ncbi:MAG: hypothetical protein ACQEVA_11420 [Myxococcota bacterium]
MLGRYQLLLGQFALIMVVLLVGCSGNRASNGSDATESSDTRAVDGETPVDSESGEVDADEQVDEASTFLDPRQVEAHGLATSQVCSDCHSNDPGTSAMRDDDGRAVAPFDLWQSSMKANSSRDPFFRAVLSAEVYRNPGAAELLESTCLRCHAPMASVAAARTETTLRLADIQEPDDIGGLASDGVSCVTCHTMTDTNFGTKESYHGGFELNENAEIYGPHADPFTNPMEMRTGYTPVESDHIKQSEMCATCHTLSTHTIIDGEVSDNSFPEQTPYLEWKNSTFSSGDNAQSCQDCHVPTTDVDGDPITTRIARRPMGGNFPPTSPRSPFGRHVYVGGNYTVAGILRDERDVLKPQASDAAFDATIAAVKGQLRNDTATLDIEGVQATDTSVAFDVVVRNKTGHKFPTAYPSRRAWIHARVTDASGGVLFETGAWNEDGQILGENGPMPFEEPFGPTEPHQDEVSSPDDVVIYEAVMANKDGESTVALMYAYEYAKDNRLLPEGWSGEHPNADETRPVGVAGDDDFVAGGDTVRFDVPISARAATIEVELVYQPLGSRWLEELFEVPTAEIERFEQMYSRADREPALVSADSVDVQ